MAYDAPFYRQYAAYLEEPTVRAAHDWVLAIAQSDPAFKGVIDFGCGQSEEFFNYTTDLSAYYGVDINGSAQFGPVDYREADVARLAHEVGRPFLVTAFVSLFSSEITAPYRENYKFYDRVFAECPNIRRGLVSGFFYQGQQHMQPIGETGGITSWQTLEPIEAPMRNGYSERRIILPVPSRMFGTGVYEVWKFFSRWGTE